MSVFGRAVAVSFLALGAAGLGLSVAADTVRLVSTDGLTDLTGELLEFDGETYALQTSLGVVRIPANEVQCSGTGCPQQNEIASTFRVIGDAGLLRGAMPEILDAYSLEVDTDITRGRAPDGDTIFQFLSYDGSPIVEIGLGETLSGDAVTALAGGQASVAITTRPISDDEAALLTGRDRRALEQLGLERVIGLDGLVAIIGRDVTIEKLSIEDLAGIYSGQITNWSQLGGSDTPISVFTREPGSDIRAAFDRLVMQGGERQIAANVISVDSNQGVASAVATFPNSIGLTSFGAIDGERMLPITDSCGRVTMPNDFTIKSETYPLSSRIYIYEPPGGVPVHARGMIDFMISDLGQQVIAETGFIDLRPSQAEKEIDVAQLALSRQSDVDEDRLLMLERYRLLTNSASRLSTTFRFSISGGDVLDGRAEADLQQLARLIRSGKMDGMELVFVGLSGPREELFRARRDSLSDARQILDRLFQDNPDVEEQLTVGFRVLGYGDALRSACLTGEASEADRRVEIWVRKLGGTSG